MTIQQEFTLEKKWLIFLIALAALVNLTGLFIPLIDPDAAVYASVTKQMVQTGNWLELFHKETDWLDKPHLQFWITAVFFKLFGFQTWAYKLPAILFVFLAAWYTFRFARKYYNERIAYWSALILLTAEHILISNNDVRAEPYLTCFIIAAVFHFSNTLLVTSWKHLVAGSFFTALALMTKGPYVLVPIVAALATQLIIHNSWKQLFHWRWIIALLLIAIFIAPELYSLWFQFDRHPEKIVFGRTNVSGIRFFLWDSQFGRFTDTGPIRGISEPTFFFHTLLWAFLPWSLLMYVGLFDRFRKIKNKGLEYFSLAGSVVTILVFSISKFQLPYYTNIIFPFLAVITAWWIEEKRFAQNQAPGVIQKFVLSLLLIALVILHYYFKPDLPAIWPLLAFMVLLFLTLVIQSRFRKKILAPLLNSAIVILAINIYLNTIFYPNLIQYHSGKNAASYINNEHPKAQVFYNDRYSASLEFYSKNGLKKSDPKDSINQGQNSIWYLTREEMDKLDEKNIPYQVIRELPEYRISMLSLKFLNKETRNSELKRMYLVNVGNREQKNRRTVEQEN